jgi:hypothetical protein
MIVSDVSTRVKRQFGDESGVQVTDADIIRWINDAQRDIAYTQEILESIATQVSVANQEKYTLPPDMINLRSVYYANAKLQVLSLQDYDNYVTSYTNPTGTVTQNAVLTGVPEVFYVWGTELSMYPIPSAAGVTIKLYFSKFPPDVVNQASTLSLPNKYDNRVVEYCLQQAYELDENFEASNLKGSQFANSLTQMGEDAQWTEHTAYPMIAVQPEDAW